MIDYYYPLNSDRRFLEAVESEDKFLGYGADGRPIWGISHDIYYKSMGVTPCDRCKDTGGNK